MSVKKKNGSRATLVEGCGTILKSNRLKGGYKLVKRKKPIGESETEKKSAPAKRRGRKAKAPVTAIVATTVPAKRRGRPAKTKTVATAPAKRRGRRKATAKA